MKWGARRSQLAFGDRVPVELGIAALAHAVVRHVHERRDLPDPRVALGLVAQERVALHVADERVEQHEARALAAPGAGSRRASARVKRDQPFRPGITSTSNGLALRQLLLDVAVDDPEVVAVAAVLVPS